MYQWRWDFLIDKLPVLLEGAIITIKLTALATALGSVIGLFISIGLLSARRLLSVSARAYVEFFRGTPLLVQVFMVGIGVPMFLGWQNPNTLVLGVAALSLNAGAYIAEIFRAGIQSIERGQMEAARSLGMSYATAMRYVIIPQAFKRVVPPLGNEFVALLKDSSLLFALAVEELMTKARLLSGRYIRPPEIYFATALIYLVMTFVFSQLVRKPEARLRTG